MRWGVRDDAADDHITTALCMEEIENCKRTSVGLNFVVSGYYMYINSLVKEGGVFKHCCY